MLWGDVMAPPAGIHEDFFRAAEELGIDLSRPERGSDEEDARRQAERG